jgi:hypothetical protein
LLEVVEEQQELPISQRVGQPLTRRALACLPHPEGVCDRRANEVRVDDWCQGYEGDALDEFRGHVVRDLKSEPGLADATRAGQRDEADIIPAQQGRDLLRLLLATDERRQ